MGSPWKMFTQAQGQELIDGTNFTWTSINGVNGRKFTSKTDSYKYIFLPAGGVWSDTTHDSAGTHGYYWSTAIFDSNTLHTWVLDFNSSDVIITTGRRFRGFSIRAVK